LEGKARSEQFRVSVAALRSYHKVSNLVPSDSVSDGKAFSQQRLREKNCRLLMEARLKAKFEVSSSPLQKIVQRAKKGETPYAIAKALGIDRHTAAKYAHLLA
jgi:hypothetical protein